MEKRRRHRAGRPSGSNAQRGKQHNLGQPIADLIPAFMKRLGIENRLWEQGLIDDWESLVGPQVARHARPGRVERKTLHIFVSNSTWLSELQRYSQKELLAKIQERFGVDRIARVRLQLDPDFGQS